MFLNIGKLAGLLLLMSISVAAIAQEKTINKSNQQWIQYYGQVKLNDKWTFFADGGFRAANNFSVSSQYIIREGITYSLNRDIQVGGGFANLGFYALGKINKAEFRPYEELSIKTRLNNIDINNRVRVEERFFKPVVDGSVNGPGTFNFRFRYSLVTSIPLFNLSKVNPDEKVVLSIGDEVFINAGKSILYNVFDQNRLMISPTVQFNKNFAVAFTYNRQFAATSTAATYNQTNVVWLQIRQKFNAVKKK